MLKKINWCALSSGKQRAVAHITSQQERGLVEAPRRHRSVVVLVRATCLHSTPPCPAPPFRRSAFRDPARLHPCIRRLQLPRDPTPTSLPCRSDGPVPRRRRRSRRCGRGPAAAAPDPSPFVLSRRRGAKVCFCKLISMVSEYVSQLSGWIFFWGTLYLSHHQF